MTEDIIAWYSEPTKITLQVSWIPSPKDFGRITSDR